MAAAQKEPRFIANIFAYEGIGGNAKDERFPFTRYEIRTERDNGSMSAGNRDTLEEASSDVAHSLARQVAYKYYLNAALDPRLIVSDYQGLNYHLNFPDSKAVGEYGDGYRPLTDEERAAFKEEFESSFAKDVKFHTDRLNLLQNKGRVDFKAACLLVADFWAEQLPTETPIVTEEMRGSARTLVKTLVKTRNSSSDALEVIRQVWLANSGITVSQDQKDFFRDTLAEALYHRYVFDDPSHVHIGNEYDGQNTEADLLRQSLQLAGIPDHVLPTRTYIRLDCLERDEAKPLWEPSRRWTATVYKHGYEGQPEPVVLTTTAASSDWLNPTKQYAELRGDAPPQKAQPREFVAQAVSASTPHFDPSVLYSVFPPRPSGWKGILAVAGELRDEFNLIRAQLPRTALEVRLEGLADDVRCGVHKVLGKLRGHTPKP